MMERLTKVMHCDDGNKLYDYSNEVIRKFKDFSSRLELMFKKLADYEDFEEIFRAKMTDTACEFLKDKEEFGKWLDRNEWITKKCDEWVRAEEQGLLLRLPCKVGDKVWIITSTANYSLGEYGEVPLKHPQEKKIQSITVTKNGLLYHVKDRAYGEISFGKTVFLTQAEAEQKLKEMESD